MLCTHTHVCEYLDSDLDTDLDPDGNITVVGVTRSPTVQLV